MTDLERFDADPDPIVHAGADPNFHYVRERLTSFSKSYKTCLLDLSVCIPLSFLVSPAFGIFSSNKASILRRYS